MRDEERALIVAIFQDDNTSVEDIGDISEEALHPSDAEKLATNLVNRLKQCECGNTLYNSATVCDKCDIEFSDAETVEEINEVADQVASQ